MLGNEWFTIDTVPKDGLNEIDLCRVRDGNMVCLVKAMWDDYNDCWVNEEEGLGLPEAELGVDDVFPPINFEPTHWRFRK